MRFSVSCWPRCYSVPGLAAEPKLDVSTDLQSQPESVTVAPDGSLFLCSASKPVIYRATKGALQAQTFIGASSEGNVSFLGVDPA
jgi:hypothetical protein